MPGLTEFLAEQPDLRLASCDQETLLLEGGYRLDAEHPAAGRVVREFQLSVHIPSSFPHAPPVVFENGGVIPCEPDFHVNGHNGSLCLGSPLALRRVLRAHPELQGFLVHTLRPYLYAVSIKLDRGGPFVFGELRHGSEGKLQDLADDLGIAESCVLPALNLALLPYEEAREMPCPCGCAKALAECSLRDRIADLRALCNTRELESLRDEFVYGGLLADLKETTRQITAATAQLRPT